MELEKNNCYQLVKKKAKDELIFLLSVDFVRTILGQNRFILNYSEVYGCIETCIDFEDIDYIYPVEIDEHIKKRLIEKWGEDLAKERGVI